MQDLFGIKVGYAVYDNSTDPFLFDDVVTSGERDTIATSDYDAENWVREQLEKLYPGKLVSVAVIYQEVR